MSLRPAIPQSVECCVSAPVNNDAHLGKVGADDSNYVPGQFNACSWIITSRHSTLSNALCQVRPVKYSSHCRCFRCSKSWLRSVPSHMICLFCTRIALDEVHCWSLWNGRGGRLKGFLTICLVLVEGRSGGRTWVWGLISICFMKYTTSPCLRTSLQ